MAIFSARERLTRLIELAGQEGIEARRALAGELADLLLNWPTIYPRGMREPFEALLEKALRDVGSETRAHLAERFVGASDMPLTILNLLVFDAGSDAKASILLQNALAAETSASIPRIRVNEAALLAAVRSSGGDKIAEIIAPRLSVAGDVAEQVVADASGTMLAVLCKGANLRRQTFSALTVLAWRNATDDESYRRLAAYDDVSDAGAEALVACWRGQVRTPGEQSEAA
jgi:hypothetical protein